MTEFSNLAALVAQGQALLDLVKDGHITQLEADNAAKLGEVDAALAAKIAQANTDVANAVAPIDGKIPHTLLTENSKLVVSSGTVPDGIIASASSSFSVSAYVERDPSNRDAGQVVLLSGIETDIKEQFADFDIRTAGHYFDGFNIMKIDWDFGVDFSGADYVMQLSVVAPLGYANRVLTSNETTSQALVKLVSGSLEDHDMVKGATLGKWRYCNFQNAFDKKDFGRYLNVYARATSQTGSLLIALPSIVTGLVSHPKHIHF
jgi:hypothetical protein